MKKKSCLQFTAEERVAQELLDAADDQAREDDNPAADAARSGVEAQRRMSETVRHSRGSSAEAQSSSASRRQQRRAIRRQYAAAKSGRTAEVSQQAAEATGDVMEKAKETVRKTTVFVQHHKRAFLIVGAIALLLAFMLSVFSSCSVMLQGAGSAVAGSTYPCEDADLLGAEAAYCAKEAELQSYLDNYASTHSYDEYRFDLDSIEHDPYVLLSFLTALHGGAWTLSDVQDDLQMLFDRQYTLTENVYTVSRFSEDGGRYDYTICTVKLENFDLSHLPVYIMGEEQLGMYATYMATLGNRSDLFPSSGYVGLYDRPTPRYEIPPEALSDERFAAMIAEAEKYLGYPYVWGGSSPSTSFDCSGFVSWVINHSGWNVGRLGATALYGICTPVSSANARPGDLIFFQGTYDTAGMSHVGIYVGNGMMLHCGNPIQYTSINTNYWQAHFAAFGRLP